MKERIAKGFDLLSPVYDRLARLIIGRDIVLSQLYFLDQFRGCKSLLILGAGTGWVLKDVCKNFTDLKIDYIELSPGMIRKARIKLEDNKQITFIQGTEDDIPNHGYDGVITNFYLDMFTERSLSRVIGKIRSAVSQDSIWVVTDFVNERKMQAIKLWCMYRFFRMMTRIEAGKLADWKSVIHKAGFRLSQSVRFNNGFITSNLYQLD